MLINILTLVTKFLEKDKNIVDNKEVSNIDLRVLFKDFKYKENQLGPYLAGLIEGDGTLIVQDKKSKAKKYSPSIRIAFKKADLPLANYLQTLINCGKVYKRISEGYVFLQIHDLINVFRVINLINGYMRTPKIEALARTIDWFNNYTVNNQFSKLPKTQKILSEIRRINNTSDLELNRVIKLKDIDTSPIDSNAWLAGFSDADANFSINICKRWKKKSTRVQLFYRLEIAQTYHRTSIDGNVATFFDIMSKISMFLGVNLLSRTRIKEDKQYFSFMAIAHNRVSLEKITEYFTKFPLISSKYLDYKDWDYILKLQKSNKIVITYLEKALNVRKDFNNTRTTFNWDHLKNCYLENWKI